MTFLTRIRAHAVRDVHRASRTRLYNALHALYTRMYINKQINKQKHTHIHTYSCINTCIYKSIHSHSYVDAFIYSASFQLVAFSYVEHIF